MEKEFVSYESALRLKELGFDEPCFGCYVFGDELSIKYCEDQFVSDSCCLAPTFSQAFRWFRDNHNLKISFAYWNGFDSHIDDNMGAYQYECYIIPQNDMSIAVKHDYDYYFKSHEEAELACLEKLIEIIEQTQE